MTANTTTRLQNLQQSLSRLQPNPPYTDQVSLQKVNEMYTKAQNYQKSDQAKFQLLADNLNKLIQAQSAEMASFALLDKKQSKYIDLVYASLTEALNNEHQIRQQLEANVLQEMQDKFTVCANNLQQQTAQRAKQDDSQLSFMRDAMTRVVEKAQGDRYDTDQLIGSVSNELDSYVEELKQLLFQEQNERESKQQSFYETLGKVCQMLQEKLQAERLERERVEEQLVGLMELICEKMR